jgi:hypothetical protein
VAGSDTYSVQEFTNYNGVYFDEVGKINFYTETFKLHVTVNTHDLAQKVEELSKYANMTCGIIKNLKVVREDTVILHT